MLHRTVNAAGLLMGLEHMLTTARLIKPDGGLSRCIYAISTEPGRHEHSRTSYRVQIDDAGLPAVLDLLVPHGGDDEHDANVGVDDVSDPMPHVTVSWPDPDGALCAVVAVLGSLRVPMPYCEQIDPDLRTEAERVAVDVWARIERANDADAEQWREAVARINAGEAADGAV